MFVGNENIIVELFYRQGKNGSMRVARNLDLVEESEKSKFQKITLNMKPMTWKIYNDLQRNSTIDRGRGSGEEIDWLLYKEKKLVTVLVGWNAKNEKGEPIPVTPENIFKLHPMMVEMALNTFDSVTLLGEEERKNS